MKKKNDTTDEALLEAAGKVRANAYAEYSGFLVGAALEDEHGVVHVGCNVENSAYPEGSCAEANAIGAMIASGARRIRRIAIVGGHTRVEDCTPCGGCRQKIAEFGGPETRILLRNAAGGIEELRLADLLPRSFRLEH